MNYADFFEICIFSVDSGRNLLKKNTGVLHQSKEPTMEISRSHGNLLISLKSTLFSELSTGKDHHNEDENAYGI